jgi:hypothetical protein
MILKLSSNHRFDYLHKVTSKLFGELHFQDHDQRIDSALLQIAAAPTHAHIRTIRELPIDLGDLSLPSTTGIESMQHYLITQHRTKLFLAAYHPLLRAVHKQRFYSTEDDGTIFSALTDSTDENYYRPVAAGAPQELSINRYKKAVKIAMKGMVQARATHLQALLAGDPRTQAIAAGLLSAMTENAGQYLRCTVLPQYGTGIKFSDNAFLEMLRHRLLILFTAPYGPAPGNCTCSTHAPINLSALPMHPLVCPAARIIIVERHDMIRDRLAKLIRVMVPENNTRVEPDNHQGALFVRRPDIYYEEHGAPKYVDVVIAEPTAQIHMNTPDFSSIDHPSAAAIMSERRKLAEYAAANQGIELEPFAVESTGRLGPSAQALLSKFCPGDAQAQALRDFLFDLSFICAATKGKLLSACRSRLSRRNEE